MIALITGGRRGIGLAIVEKLKSEGYTVAVVAKSKEPPPDCDLYLQADLTNTTACRYIVERVVNQLGGLDVLVNNAGAQYLQPATEYTHWDEQMTLLLTSPFKLMRHAAKAMEASGGSIVNILSTASVQGGRNISGYVAAKHGLLGLTRALALEWAPLIRVNGIIPGLIDTDMTSDITPERRELLTSLIPARRFGQASEVAEAVWFLINQKYIYGQTIIVDGGWMVKNG